MRLNEVNDETTRTFALCNDEKVGQKYRGKFERIHGGTFFNYKGKWTWDRRNLSDAQLAFVEKEGDLPLVHDPSILEKKVKVEKTKEKPAKKRKKKSTFGFKKDIYNNDVSEAFDNKSLDEKE